MHYCYMILETIPAISALTVDQKLRLVGELWNEVSRQPDMTPAIAALLDERMADYDARPESVRTTEQVTAGIMALKQRVAKPAHD
ncbi:MAG: addiction module protein [Prosthecobacter sp.]|nr:addiction module protein [Prosthecobacter sp.]